MGVEDSGDFIADLDQALAAADLAGGESDIWHSFSTLISYRLGKDLLLGRR